MKKPLCILVAFLLVCASSTPTLAQAVASPRLSVQLFANQSVRLTWPDTAADFDLEEAGALNGFTWARVAQTPLRQSGEFSVALDASAASRFFRLRFQGYTTIRETSPAHGEQGVAVTRETILRFTRPLAASTTLTANHLYAEFAGRKMLSRVELSSDRKTVTLFYLENLPASARVRVTFNPFALLDSAGRIVDVDGDGQPGGVKLIDFYTLGTTPVGGTAIIGTVFASDPVPGTTTTNFINRPLPGVTITVDGMEETLRTVTDSNGSFRLSPCPAGAFFVHIDGRTLTNVAAGIRYPDLSYYPTVGKSWRAVAGRTNNIAGFMPGSTNAASSNGWIFLPLITQGTLQPVSITADTMITFPPSVLSNNPALAGVTLMVPANSLFSDNGTRGGKVGIAPVPPDRLPGPLPPGLEFPLVITVQTDGPLNFDRPAPICFPNLPDPVLGVPLPANSKQALISFNHDKGIWEAVGSMTVSADGKFICSDPGEGILQPGWHGVGPLPDGPPPPPKPLPCLNISLVPTCIRICNQELDACKEKVENYVWAGMHVCGELRRHGLDEEADKCYDDFNQKYNDALDACSKAFVACLERCKPCPPAPAPVPGVIDSAFPALRHASSIAQASLDPTAPIDPILDEIEAIIEQIVELIRPFAETRSPIPLGVRGQIEALFDHADTLAGGDAANYLKHVIISSEDELAAAAREIGLEPEDLNPGNAPAYPVLYVATIARPDSLFFLRGETGPFGQYFLFIPRDGTLLSVSFFDPKAKQFGLITPNLRPNARFRLPSFTLFPLASDAPDFDGDGLPDVVEDVFGTDPEKVDSDGDGVFDGAEVDQGTNPLDGVPVRIGIVGTARTPGSAVDVAAANDLLAVAQGTTGVSLFNIFNGMNPVLIAHVDTPGTAQAVAMSGSLVAVADGDRGLAIMDVSDPATARIVHQIQLGGNAQAVAVAGRVAYAAFSSPQFASQPAVLAKVDLITGNVLEKLSLAATSGGLDVAVAGDQVYVLRPASLLVHGEAGGPLVQIGQLAIGSGVPPHLFVGGGLAYVGQTSGHSVIDVNNPVAPVLIGAPPTAELGLQDLATTGSGLLVATTVFVQGSQQVALYDASQPTNVTRFLTLFDTPGDARALTIHNGFAYVADSAAGIQVINYLPFDRDGVPPVISLNTSATGGVAETARPLRVTANATDDVQVRNVEFYIDGVRAFSDGNFPFEYRFDPPAFTAVRTNFTLRARAIDTGGNFTWSDELTIALGPDVTPPRVTATTPFGGAKVVSSVFAYFSEPMNPATLSAASFQLISAGDDGLFNTADDLPVGGGTVAYHVENFSVSLDFATALSDGLYLAVVTTAAADTAGNPLASDYTWQFRVADAVFWNRSTDGLWEDGFNWSTGTPPGSADDVFIESIPADVTITHASGTSVIRSLVVGERMAIIGGTMQVSNVIELRQPLTLNGGTLKGGTVTQNGEARLFFAANAANTLDGVNVEGDLVLTNTGARTLIRNGLSLTGSVMLDNGGIISFVGNQTFATGSIVFAGNSGSLGIANGTTLTLGPAMVVRGKTGLIGASVFTMAPGNLINQGLISADVAGGTLTLNPTQFDNTGTVETRNGGSMTMLLSGGGWRNAGVIDAGGGGTLTLNGAWTNSATITVNEATVNLGGAFTLANFGTFNRTGGTVNVTGVLDLGGGTLVLDATSGSWQMNGGTLKGGTVTQSGDGKLLFAANAANTLDGVSVEGDLVLTNTGARTLIRNGLSLTGSVVLDNGGGISFVGSQTFAGGSIVFAGNSGSLGIANGTTLTLGPAMVVRGKTGLIGASVFTMAPGNLINQGLISADVAGGTLTLNPTQFDNTGTVETRNGGSMTILLSGGGWRNAGVIDAGGGTLTLNGAWTNSATITANEATVNLGGAFALANFGTFNRTGGTVNVTGVLDLGGGTLALDAAAGSWQMNGGTLKGGTVTQSGGGNLLFAGGAVSTLDGVTLDGDLVLTNLSVRVLIRNGLALTGSVQLDNENAISFSGSQTFQTGQVVFAGNSGLLGIEPGTTLTLGPTVIVRGRSGRIGPSMFNFSGTRRLINQGLIAADVPSGTLTINPTEFENTGILRADGAGAMLVIRANPFTDTGTIEELNGGDVQINP